jgi:hypothetical protein
MNAVPFFSFFLILVAILFKIAGIFIPKMYVAVGGLLEFGLFYARSVDGKILSYDNSDRRKCKRRLVF